MRSLEAQHGSLGSPQGWEEDQQGWMNRGDHSFKRNGKEGEEAKAICDDVHDAGEWTEDPTREGIRALRET